MKQIIIILMMLIFASANAEEKLAPELAKAVYKAQEKMKTKDYKGAVSILQDFRKENTADDAGVYYLALGNAYYSSGEKQKAFDIFSVGHKKYPAEKDICSNAAITAYELEKYPDAGELFYSLYKITKKPEHLYRAGVAMYLGHKMREAEKLSDELLSKSGQQKIEWLKLAISIKMESSKWRSALNIIAGYLQKAPADAQMWRIKAQVYLNMERFAEAASSLETAYSLKAPDEKELKNLADIYRYTGANVRAAKTLAKVSRSEEELIRLSEYYGYAGMYAEAVDVIDRLMKRSQNAKLIRLKGKYLYLAGEYKKASEVLKNAASGDGEAHMLMAVCAWQTGELKVVKKAYEKASRLKAYRRTSIQGLRVVEQLIADQAAVVN